MTVPTYLLPNYGSTIHRFGLARDDLIKSIDQFQWPARGRYGWVSGERSVTGMHTSPTLRAPTSFHYGSPLPWLRFAGSKPLIYSWKILVNSTQADHCLEKYGQMATNSVYQISTAVLLFPGQETRVAENAFYQAHWPIYHCTNSADFLKTLLLFNFIDYIVALWPAVLIPFTTIEIESFFYVIYESD